MLWTLIILPVLAVVFPALLTWAKRADGNG